MQCLRCLNSEGFSEQCSKPVLTDSTCDLVWEDCVQDIPLFPLLLEAHAGEASLTVEIFGENSARQI